MSNDNTYPATSVADYIIKKASEQNRGLTPLQVIKLVYLCHGWMLGLYGKPLIRECVEAWRYGPVVRDLYRAVRTFKGEPVPAGTRLSVETTHFEEDEKNIMDQVVEIYKDFSGTELSTLTHRENTPWYRVWHKNIANSIIGNESIKAHFKGLVPEGSNS